MIGKWFSRPGKDADKADAPPKPQSKKRNTPPPAPVVGGAPTPSAKDVTPDLPNWDSRTVIMRADPATLVLGTSGLSPPPTNVFDAATLIMRPDTGFDSVTRVVGAQPPSDREAPDKPLPVGTLLNERYEVIKPIGRGGFSYVYLCQHRRNGRLNAVKEAYAPGCGRAGTEVIANDGALLRQATDALLREVSGMSRINHPGVVRFEDVFEANGTLCFAMDFVEGEPLADLLARRHAVSSDTFASLASSLLDAVEALHTNDVLHGDIKPGNIIIRPDKSVVLIDFGTAVRLTDVTYAEPILTPGYSAPERYVPDGDVGAWSDVYSCAATLGAAMAGRPPPEPDDAGSYEADLAAFIRVAKERFPDESWIRGPELGLRHDIAERTNSIPDLRAAMGMAAQSGESLPAAARGDGHSIFISYAREDSAIVEKLVREIQRRGVGIWIDRQGIKPGSRAWGLEILNGMRDAQIVLLFSSARSMASDNVKDEVYLAKELEKPIVVARLDQAPFSDEILIFLTRTQHIAATEMASPAFAAAIVDVLNTDTAVPA